MFATFGTEEKPSTIKPESTQAINAANVPDTIQTIPKSEEKEHNVLPLARIQLPLNQPTSEKRSPYLSEPANCHSTPQNVSRPTMNRLLPVQPIRNPQATNPGPQATNPASILGIKVGRVPETKQIPK